MTATAVEAPTLAVRGAQQDASPASARSTTSRSTCCPASVHALVGENGAGKSTLIKVMTGVYPLDSGEVLLPGRGGRASPRPRAAQQAGIATIYQEVHLAPQLLGGPQLLPRPRAHAVSARSTCAG